MNEDDIKELEKVVDYSGVFVATGLHASQSSDLSDYFVVLLVYLLVRLLIRLLKKWTEK